VFTISVGEYGVAAELVHSQDAGLNLARGSKLPFHIFRDHGLAFFVHTISLVQDIERDLTGRTVALSDHHHFRSCIR
jgi:hypothetical protein